MNTLMNLWYLPSDEEWFVELVDEINNNVVVCDSFNCWTRELSIDKNDLRTTHQNIRKRSANVDFL